MKTSPFFSPLTVALAVGVLTCLGTAGRARAATFHVATAQELQTTLFTAQANGQDDTIYFAAGIYSGQFTFNSTEAQSLTMLTETNAPVGQVVVSGNMSLSAGNAPSITVRGITFKNGSPGLAVGTSGTISLVGCVFQACSGGFATTGNCAFSCSGSLMTGNSGRAGYLVGCRSVFLGHNTVQGNVGGVVMDGGVSSYRYAMTGPVTVVGNRFVGGGTQLDIYNNGATVVSNNVFKGNTSGAMSASSDSGNSGSVVSVNNQFVQNSGGNTASCGARSVVFQGNTFRGNSMGGSGNTCIAYLNGVAYLNCANNLFVSNSVPYGRGAIWVQPGVTNWVANNTVCGNVGNGMTLLPGTWTHIHNNILWGNSGVDVIVGTGGSLRSLYNNDYHSISGLVDLAVNNIDVDPLFVDAPGGDYHLRANSGCINAGLNYSTNGSPALPLIDKDGNVRIADGIVDIGAYEQARADQHPADTDTNWVMSVAEFTAYATAWTNRAAWATGPNPIPIDYVTRAGYLAGTNSGAYHNEGGGKPRNWKPGF
jgi:hypothetical protein